MLLEVKFEGGLADDHKIPAYEGAKSLEGITRSILISSNYLVEGRVRRRDFTRANLDFNLVAQRPGSFDAILEIGIAAAEIAAPIAVVLGGGVAGNLLTDLLKTVYQRVTGTPERQVGRAMQDLETDRPGDVAALIDASEPAIKLGHNVINNGIININVSHTVDERRERITRFTPDTKEYVLENIENNRVRIKLFSIASFNANQGTGRAFDLEEGRSIPFKLMDDVDRRSINTLLNSIAQYTRRRQLGDDLRSAVAVRYTSLDALDGRAKRLNILAVRNEIADF